MTKQIHAPLFDEIKESLLIAAVVHFHHFIKLPRNTHMNDKDSKKNNIFAIQETFYFL